MVRARGRFFLVRRTVPNGPVQLRVGEEVGEGRSEWCQQRDRAGGMYVCMGVAEGKPRVGRRRGEMTMTKIGVRVV